MSMPGSYLNIRAELANRNQSRRDWQAAHITIAQNLLAHAWRMPSPVTVEIGVAYGDMSCAIMRMALPALHVGVDPYTHRGDYADAMNAPQERQDIRRELAWRQMQYQKPRRTSVRLVPSIEDATRELHGALIGFAFVDGDHSYAAVCRDLAWLWDHAAHGALLAGHDYGDPGWPGVTQAVDEWAAARQLRVQQLSAGVWMTVKP